METARVIAGDISEDFYNRMVATFPVELAVWKSGDDVAEAAFKAGRQSLIEWIYRHASIATTRSF